MSLPPLQVWVVYKGGAMATFCLSLVSLLVPLDGRNDVGKLAVNVFFVGVSFVTAAAWPVAVPILLLDKIKN